MRLAKRCFLPITFVLLFGLGSSFSDSAKTPIKALYNSIESKSTKPGFDVFEKALAGYHLLEKSGRLGDKNLLTIIDFSLSSRKKRLWVIDLSKKQVLHHTLVAHGKNTGEEYASSFSNAPQSYKSSLGFYVTGSTYHGKHGLSLYLNGVEKGVNDNARDRAIVMHGANYVSFDFVEKHGRLGRSFGCPALPMSKYEEIIPLLADKTCLFIYYPDNRYLEQSKLL